MLKRQPQWSVRGQGPAAGLLSVLWGQSLLSGLAGGVRSSVPDAALSWLRLTALAGMLAIALAWPMPARTGHPIIAFVLLFGAYNLVVELTRYTVPRLRSLAWVPFLDLPIAGLLYYLDTEPGGPFFVAFFLAVITAAMTLPLRGALLYTLIVVALIIAVAPSLPLWSPTPRDLRQLAARMLVLVMVGVGSVLMTRWLAHQEAMAQVVHTEARKVEELARLRTDFVASISHDLRTPLTAAQAALGFLDTTAGATLSLPERDLLANARRNVERLGMLIDDLLTANQLEAGVLQIDREPLDLRTVAADAMSAVHPLARKKRQRLEVDLSEPLPLVGDARRLEQVLVNLLANAHRHAPAGSCITITGRRGGGEARVAVLDDGHGLPPEDLQRVFDRSYRRGPEGGSGLGLWNARGIIALHGGRIWAENRSEGGAAFRVALPLHEQDEAPCP